jgi:hypothetical protein
MSEYPLKRYPFVGACGLDCGLCPRYRTSGSSKCPGCAGKDFEQEHPPCGFITCCVKQKHLETCAQCPDRANCQRVRRILEGSKQGDSFISYRPLASNCAFVQKNGIEKYTRQVMAKMKLLDHLLEHFDEGRSKTFYCTSCQLLPLDALKLALDEVETEITENADIKEKSRLVRAAFNRLGDALGIDLKLRK